MRTYLLSFTLICAFCNIHSINIARNINYADYFRSLTDNIEYSTPSPIDIQSDKAIPVNLPPLIAVADFAEPVLLTNTGEIIEAVVTTPSTRSYITSGVLGSNVYDLYRVRFYFSNDHTKSCATTFDGYGSSLQVYVTYFKREYHNFENAALNYQGIFDLIYDVKVQGNIANANFTQFESLLSRVIRSNSSVPTTNGAVASWLNSFNPVLNYYTYYGATRDLQGRILFDYAINSFVGLGFSQYISVAQFNAFRQLLNSGDGPLTPVLGVFPQGERVLVEAQGLHYTTLNRAGYC